MSVLAMMDVRKQAVTGLIPPLTSEAKIREVWPSVAAYPVLATLGRKLILSKFLAPLGWALMLPIYFAKILPFVATRYTLTNRHVMIRKGLKPASTKSMALSEIEDVRVVSDDNSDFFRAGTLEIVGKGRVALTLRGVPEPESFRHAILNACKAWVKPGNVEQPAAS